MRNQCPYCQCLVPTDKRADIPTIALCSGCGHLVLVLVKDLDAMIVQKIDRKIFIENFDLEKRKEIHEIQEKFYCEFGQWG